MKLKNRWKRLRKQFSHSSADELFEGHDNLFKEAVVNSKTYGEYGCGASTLWVLKNTSATVVSVESDPIWSERVASDRAATGRLTMQLVDIGPVQRFGRPIDYTKRENFKSYAEVLWHSGNLPDTVLIDGRFRVHCFFTSLLLAPAGTTLIFDDYAKRPHYHIVEEFVDPVARNDRQALFVVPNQEMLDPQAISTVRDKFEYVMD